MKLRMVVFERVSKTDLLIIQSTGCSLRLGDRMTKAENKTKCKKRRRKKHIQRN